MNANRAEPAEELGTELREALERDGYSVVPGILDEPTVATLAEAVARVRGEGSARRRGGQVFAMRNLLRDVPEVRAVAASPAVRALVEPVLGRAAFPVRGLFFDKTPAANWNVAWHQDSMIPVRERREAPGFRAWSVKAGVPHVLPPDAVLQGMLHVRLHLDDCGAENGPLRVKPGSHAAGRLDDGARERWGRAAPTVTCLVPRGGALLMRPLLLHASSPAHRPAHRRVIHLEFAAAPLPGGLEWAES